jgi:tRNA-Thr(GGU) m(6)t(6)A37 methyltransferase TsaA
MESEFRVRAIGVVRSSLTALEGAPRQGNEGAPSAIVEVASDVLAALDGLVVGQDVILLSWFHRARRDVLSTHPRNDLARPRAGVFCTRSPDRPNPIGLHRVRVLAIAAGRLEVAPLEAIDGTPIIDIKPVLDEVADG